MMFLSRHVSDVTGLEVRSEWQYLEDPHRVGAVFLTLDLPSDLSEPVKKGLLRSVEHCTVKNTLENPPKISIRTEIKNNPL